MTQASPPSHASPSSANSTLANPSHVTTLRRVPTSGILRSVAIWLGVMMLITLVAMVVIPWQQNATGTGRVVPYAPLERQQTVQSNVSGRIVAWRPGIVEGAQVKRGDEIVEIQDIDPQFLQRISAQLDATNDKLRITEDKVLAYSRQVDAYREARRQAVSAAEQAVDVARQELIAAQEGLTAAHAGHEQELAELQRQERLHQAGIASTAKLQMQQRREAETKAKLRQAEAYLEAARNKVEAKKAELVQKERESQAKVDYAIASEREAMGEVTLVRKELLDLETKLSRQDQIVKAPRDGIIVRLHAFEGGEIVKQGDPLFSLMPEPVDQAVEMWVNGNDLPLVAPGRHVRLQFEGWPAIQIGGWPAAALGTYGGRVANVDATDDGKGRFRVLVVPDTDGDPPWPSHNLLRQGVRANGWILLNRVMLGYEIWRQLNAFPPDYPQEDKDPNKPQKVPLPK